GGRCSKRSRSWWSSPRLSFRHRPLGAGLPWPSPALRAGAGPLALPLPPPRLLEIETYRPLLSAERKPDSPAERRRRGLQSLRSSFGSSPFSRTSLPPWSELSFWNFSLYSSTSGMSFVGSQVLSSDSGTISSLVIP